MKKEGRRASGEKLSFYLKKYMWLISLVAVVFCSFFLAKMTANLVAAQFEGFTAPSGDKASKGGESTEEESKDTKSADTFKPIIERNIFDSADTGVIVEEVEVVEDEVVDTTGVAHATNLKIKLVSTFSVGKGEDKRSTCIISSGGKGKKGSEEVYTVDSKEQFAPDTKIIRILYNRVEFTNKGRLEFVELEDFTKLASLNVPPQRGPSTIIKRSGGDKGPKIEKSGEGKFVIDRAEIDAAIANLDKLYTQIRAVPHFKDGRPNGLKLLSVRGGSIFAKLGMRRGDILQRINGMELDIKKGLEIFNQLKTETSVIIDVERRGKKETLEYEIR